MNKKPIIVVMACWLLASCPAFAGIPEPDNVVYGDVTLEGEAPAFSLVGVAVEARKIEFDDSVGPAIASYAIGDKPAAGENYVVRVKVDSGSATRPGALVPGERFALFIEGVQVSEPMFAAGLGAPGHAFRRVALDLGESQLATSGEVVAHLLGHVQLTGLARASADIDGSGNINIADAILIQQREQAQAVHP